MNVTPLVGIVHWACSMRLLIRPDGPSTTGLMTVCSSFKACTKCIVSCWGTVRDLFQRMNSTHHEPFWDSQMVLLGIISVVVMLVDVRLASRHSHLWLLNKTLNLPAVICHHHSVLGRVLHLCSTVTGESGTRLASSSKRICPSLEIQK